MNPTKGTIQKMSPTTDKKARLFQGVLRRKHAHKAPENRPIIIASTSRSSSIEVKTPFGPPRANAFEELIMIRQARR